MIPRPQRQPNKIWRVQWTRSHWTRDRAGGPRWKGRWYLRHSDAATFVRKLEEAGAQVVLDSFDLAHTYRRPPLEELEARHD